ncbi:MAG: hypothetical protein HBSAPP03_16220 [Phycisphaerae bacterium]|nr:MAG: hypothetical protein HBSAPP03_16220 [Phycisphaerae bacterium]
MKGFRSEKPNVVVFCGAGFSAIPDIGIPTMDGFSDSLRRSRFLTIDEQKELDHVQETCNALAAVIGASARNVEQLCSFLSLLRVARPAFRFDGNTTLKTPSDAETKLRECMAFVFGKPHLAGGSTNTTYSRLIVPCAEANLTFITTNYDLHLEMTAAKSGWKIRGAHQSLHPRGYLSPEPSPNTVEVYTHDSWSEADRSKYGVAEKADDAPSFRLFKLHGSVGWAHSTGGIFAEHEIAATTMQMQNAPTHRPIPTHCHLASVGGSGADEAMRWCRQGQNFVMVPPTVIKPNRLDDVGTDPVGLALRDQWVGASTALQSADYLWFIGYGFPLSDSFMRFFLGASLFQNVRLRQIAVVDLSSKVIRDRAKPLFAAPHLQEVFRALPCSWDQVNFSALLSGDYRHALQAALTHIRQDRDFDTLTTL